MGRQCKVQWIWVIVAGLLFPGLSHAASRASTEQQFQAFLVNDVWPQAQKAGISKSTFETTTQGLTINWNLPDLVPPGTTPPGGTQQTQAEFSAPARYFAEKQLVALAAQGKALMSAHAATLRSIEKTYRVPASVILAIWGRETHYGRAIVPHSEIGVLATKAFMASRKDLFLQELIAAMQIVQSGSIDLAVMKGSWAGAMGQPQFLPSSYLAYAVDFDGDGRKDIWNSIPDSLASIAHYLAQKGWDGSRSWGYEVTIPNTVSCAQEGPDLAQPLKVWASTGITRISGKDFPKGEMGADSMMLVPAGRHGPQFIVTPNFYVIKQYNNSDLYALYIANLADRIAYGSGAFKTPWGDVGKMLRSDIAAMQKALAAKGHDVGGADGFPGFKTRRTIGRWQESKGMAATCFPDPSLGGRF